MGFTQGLGVAWPLDLVSVLRSHSLQWRMERRQARVEAVCFNQCYINAYYTTMSLHRCCISNSKSGVTRSKDMHIWKCYAYNPMTL